MSEFEVLLYRRFGLQREFTRGSARLFGQLPVVRCPSVSCPSVKTLPLILLSWERDDEFFL